MRKTKKLLTAISEKIGLQEFKTIHTQKMDGISYSVEYNYEVGFRRGMISPSRSVFTNPQLIPIIDIFIGHDQTGLNMTIPIKDIPQLTEKLLRAYSIYMEEINKK